MYVHEWATQLSGWRDPGIQPETATSNWFRFPFLPPNLHHLLYMLSKYGKNMCLQILIMP